MLPPGQYPGRGGETQVWNIFNWIFHRICTLHLSRGPAGIANRCTARALFNVEKRVRSCNWFGSRCWSRGSGPPFHWIWPSGDDDELENEEEMTGAKKKRAILALKDFVRGGEVGLDGNEWHWHSGSHSRDGHIYIKPWAEVECEDIPTELLNYVQSPVVLICLPPFTHPNCILNRLNFQSMLMQLTVGHILTISDINLKFSKYAGMFHYSSAQTCIVPRF